MNIGRNRKAGSRPYRAPQREAAAARTRTAIVEAAKELFEEHGWAATTIRGIGDAAGVSPKTVEALFGTKAALLQTSVEYAIRGDIDPLPMPQRVAVAHMEAAPTAQKMLDLHATHLRQINQRSARLAWAIEQAAPADSAVASLWRQMNRNRTYAVDWATDTLLSKPGRRRGLQRQRVLSTFWVAIDWGTYRTLTGHAGLTPEAFERWLRAYYRSLLVDNR